MAPCWRLSVSLPLTSAAVACGPGAAKVSVNGNPRRPRWPRKDSLMNDETRLRDGFEPRESPPGSVAAAGIALPGTGPTPGAGSGVYAALDLGTNNCRLLIA